jgi:hypothetical protein
VAHSGDHLENGAYVAIQFEKALSQQFREPQGTIYTPNAKELIVFSDQNPPFEAYGYDPRRLEATPIPFWGDHYIKPAQRGAPSTLWAWIKERVNTEIFLPSVEGLAVQGQLYWTRKHHQHRRPKLICPNYHAHLVEAYEAIWAITAAIRKWRPESIRPHLWKPTSQQMDKIRSSAVGYSASAKRPLYGLREFIEKIIQLEVEGLSPHYQPIRNRYHPFASQLFEVLVAEYIRERGFDVSWSHKPDSLEGEVDLIVRSAMPQRCTLICSCKLRTYEQSKPVLSEEVENLLKRLQETTQHEKKGLARTSSPLEIAGAIFSNASEVSEKATALAKQHGIAIVRVAVSHQWWKEPSARKKLKLKHFKVVMSGGGPILGDLLQPKSGI